MASWRFTTCCPYCGNRQNISQELKDHFDIYLTICDADSGGCGKPFGYEARQSVLFGKVYALQEQPS